MITVIFIYFIDKPILYKHLTDAGLITSLFGSKFSLEKLYYADEPYAEALLNAFMQLVEIVGLELYHDNRKVFLEEHFGKESEPQTSISEAIESLVQAEQSSPKTTLGDLVHS